VRAPQINDLIATGGVAHCDALFLLDTAGDSTRLDSTGGVIASQTAPPTSASSADPRARLATNCTTGLAVSLGQCLGRSPLVGWLASPAGARPGPAWRASAISIQRLRCSRLQPQRWPTHPGSGRATYQRDTSVVKPDKSLRSPDNYVTT